MGGLSVWHWLIFLVVALLLFGGSGKISSIMGDVAKGIKSFKKGMTEDDETAAQAGDRPLQEGRAARHRQRGQASTLRPASHAAGQQGRLSPKAESLAGRARVRG